MQFEAAVLFAPKEKLEIRTVVGRDLGPTDVLVKIGAAGLCHTDLEVIQGQLRTPLPIVLGHEAAGEVVDVGGKVESLHKGDHVVLSWNPHCNSCFYCERQLPILCETYRENAAVSMDFDGRPLAHLPGGEPLRHLMYLGAFGQYCVVPEHQAIVVSKEIPFDRACLIGCGVMTGVGAALNIARVEKGATVLVIGCGAVGLSAVQGARMAKAKRIIAADFAPAKRKLALTLGATEVIDPAAQDLIAAIMELTHGRGVDVVLESAGNPVSFRASTEAVRPGGEIVWLGKTDINADVSFRWGALMQEKRIRRSSYGGAVPARDFPALARAYLEGALMLDELITARIDLRSINEGFDALREGTAIRSVIVAN